MFLIYKTQQYNSLKQDILQLLDNQEDYLPMQQIVDTLKYPALNSVKITCSQLREEISQLYTPEQMELVISVRGGVKLYRNGVNFQLLMDHDSQKGITPQIMSLILLERSLNTEEMCSRLFISKSTLRRKIKNISAVVDPQWNLHVSLSDKVNLCGDESTIRALYLIYLMTNCENVKDIPGIKEPQKLSALGKKILDYLHVNLLENQMQAFLIWLFVIEKAHLLNKKLSPEDKIYAYLDDYHYLPKPDFLSWCEADWENFLLIIHFFGYEFLDDAIELKKPDTLFKEEVQAWIHTCRHYFHPILPEQQKKIEKQLHNQLRFHHFLPLNDIIFNLLQITDLQNLQESFPHYLARFSAFQKKLTSNCAIFGQWGYLKTCSFFACLNVAPLNTFTPLIKLFLYSDLPHSSQIVIKEQLNAYLTGISCTFIEQIRDADLILSTTSLSKNFCSDQEVIQINPNITKNDLKTIRSRFATIALKKDPFFE